MADLRDVNLNRLAIFVAVVDAGSLTAAAELGHRRRSSARTCSASNPRSARTCWCAPPGG